jgi:hypothetical protein
MVAQIASLWSDTLWIHARQEQSCPGSRELADAYHARSKADSICEDTPINAQRIILIGVNNYQRLLVQNEPVSALLHVCFDRC